MASFSSPRVIIVTGAASGMGLSCAQALFSSGYSVALVDLFQTSLDKVIAEAPFSTASSEGSPKVWGIAADVGDTDKVKAMFEAVKNEFGGRIHGIAHCAGIMGSVGWCHEQSEEEQLKIVNVNVMGTVRVVTEAVRTFREQGEPPVGGYSIVTIGSFTIARPPLKLAVYAASKGFVKSFNQGIARENASAGIRVNTVNPGGIRTPMVEEIIAARGDSMPADVVPMERWGTSQEVAHVVEFLISEKASFVTGSNYDVDGGRNC